MKKVKKHTANVIRTPNKGKPKRTIKTYDFGTVRKRIRKDTNVLIWGVFILVLLIIVNGIVITSRLQQAAAREATELPKVGKSFAIMNFNWQDNIPANVDMFKLDKNFKIVGIDLQIINLRAVNIWLAPSIESYIIDDSGARYGMVFASEVSQPFTAGSYEPQQVAGGELTYAIPKNSKEVRWCYDIKSYVGADSLCIPLNKYSMTKQ